MKSESELAEERRRGGPHGREARPVREHGDPGDLPEFARHVAPETGKEIQPDRGADGRPADSDVRHHGAPQERVGEVHGEQHRGRERQRRGGRTPVRRAERLQLAQADAQHAEQCPGHDEDREQLG